MIDMLNEHRNLNMEMIDMSEQFTDMLQKRHAKRRWLYYAWILVTVLIGIVAVGWAVMGYWLNAACNAAWVFIALTRIADQRLMTAYIDMTAQSYKRNAELHQQISNFEGMVKACDEKMAIYEEMRQIYKEMTKVYQEQAEHLQQYIDELKKNQSKQ